MQSEVYVKEGQNWDPFQVLFIWRLLVNQWLLANMQIREEIYKCDRLRWITDWFSSCWHNVLQNHFNYWENN